MKDRSRQKTVAYKLKNLNPGRPKGHLVEKDHKQPCTDTEEEKGPLLIFRWGGCKEDKGADANDYDSNQPRDTKIEDSEAQTKPGGPKGNGESFPIS